MLNKIKFMLSSFLGNLLSSERKPLAIPASILLVSEENRQVWHLLPILQAHGWTAFCVHNYEDVLQKIETEKPNIVILDYALPGMPIWEIVKHLSQASVLMIGAPESVQRAHQGEGVDMWFSEPLKFAEIVVAIKFIHRRVINDDWDGVKIQLQDAGAE